MQQRGLYLYGFDVEIGIWTFISGLFVLIIPQLAYGLWMNGYFRRKGIKHVEPDFTLTGNLTDVVMGRQSLKDRVQEIYRSFKKQKYVGIIRLAHPVILLKDLELINKVMTKDYEHFKDRDNVINADIDPLIGRGLFYSTGKRWLELKDSLSPIFTNVNLRSILEFIEISADNMVKYLQEQENVENTESGVSSKDIHEIFLKYSNDVITKVAFGLKLNTFRDPKNKYFEMAKQVTSFSWTLRWKYCFFAIFPTTMKVFNVKYLKNRFVQFYVNKVKESINIRESIDPVKYIDVVQQLVQAKNKLPKNGEKQNGKKELSNMDSDLQEEVQNYEQAAQALSFIFGGLESMALSMSYAAHELANSTESQHKLQQEIDNFISKKDGKLDYSDVQDLKYLDMVVSETLRLWPPVPVANRVCTSTEYELPSPDAVRGTYHLSKEDRVWIPIYSIHRDPSYFNNPNQFDPERFSEENKSAIRPYSYLPFGSGPRHCIGTKLAILVTKVMLLKMVTNYEFVSTTKTEVPIQLKTNSFLLIPKNGVWIGLKPRK